MKGCGKRYTFSTLGEIPFYIICCKEERICDDCREKQKTGEKE